MSTYSFRFITNARAATILVESNALLLVGSFSVLHLSAWRFHDRRAKIEGVAPGFGMRVFRVSSSG